MFHKHMLLLVLQYSSTNSILISWRPIYFSRKTGFVPPTGFIIVITLQVVNNGLMQLQIHLSLI